MLGVPRDLIARYLKGGATSEPEDYLRPQAISDADLASDMAEQPPDPMADLRRRYLAAQQQGDGQAALGRAASYFDGLSARYTNARGVPARPLLGPQPDGSEPGRALERQAGAEASMVRATTPPAAKASARQKSTDPASEESRLAQARVRSVLAGVLTDEEIANVTEESEGTVMKYGSLARRDEVSREGQVGATQRAKDDLAFRAKQLASQEGRDFAKMTIEQQQFWLRMAENEKERAYRRQKDERTLNERNVGGWEFDPNDPPSAEAAKKMQDTTIDRDVIFSSLSNLESMYSALGSEQVGEAAGTMESDWINITNRLRKINDMGVPNGNDYVMLAKQIEDPTEWKAITTSKARGLAKMRAVRRQIEAISAATARALKYTEAGRTQRPEPSQPKGPAPASSSSSGGSTPAPAPAPTAPAMRRIRDTRTGRTGRWDGRSPLPPGVEVIGG